MRVRTRPSTAAKWWSQGAIDHLELVAKDGEITLYVRDEDDKPDTTKGLAATATVLAAGKQVTVKLEPQGGNVMKGKGTFVVAKGMRVVVSLTHARAQARDGAVHAGGLGCLAGPPVMPFRKRRPRPRPLPRRGS